MSNVDLHNHTIASDGELTGEELVDLSLQNKLKAVAITDHDSLASVERAIAYSEGKNIEVISGIEVSTDDSLFNYDKIDIIGLFVDVKNQKLVKLTEHIKNKREENKRKTIDKLKKLGYDIEYEEVKKTVKGTFGRPHIAKYLLKKYSNKFSSVRDVFDKLLEKGKEGFIQTHDRISIRDAINTINGAGGVSILAHPGIYPRENSLKLIDFFIENGGDGIETYYPYHIICPQFNLDSNGNRKMINFYRDIAKSKKVLESGGNDYHGNYRPTQGLIKIPYKVLQNLRNGVPSS